MTPGSFFSTVTMRQQPCQESFIIVAIFTNQIACSTSTRFYEVFAVPVNIRMCMVCRVVHAQRINMSVNWWTPIYIDTEYYISK